MLFFKTVLKLEPIEPLKVV